MPSPFHGEQLTLIQPDGSALWVKGWGNQYHARFEALNGYPVVEDPVTGYYQYAAVGPHGDTLIPTGARPRMVDPRRLGIEPASRVPLAATKASAMKSGLTPGKSRWEQRRRLQRQALLLAATEPAVVPAPPRRETVGDFTGLCLLIQFPDVPGTIAREEVEAFCNGERYSGFDNNGSVYDCFLENSGGRLRYRNVVAPYYTAAQPRAYYTNEKIPQPVRTLELIKEALTYHKSQGFDFTGLTVDEEQYVYATNVFYAGTRVNNWAKGLWPHSHHLATRFPLTPGRDVYDYQISDMGDALSLGTICHENGHMICDFPDLYDYGYESSGVGAFCLMCAGANRDPRNPPQVGAYLKYKAGWAQGITPVTPDLSATARAGSNQFFIHSRSRSEYFLVENRYRQGRDAALPGSGLAIWHVDELGDNQNEAMTPKLHYECSLMQADGRNDLEKDPHNQGDDTDLFADGFKGRFNGDTSPNSRWWDGSDSGLDISAIGPAGPQISFHGNVPAATP